MGYTVYSLEGEDRHQGSGMTLAEAFARMMALAHCNPASRFRPFGNDPSRQLLTCTA
jgi:hypothetical protein